MSGEPSPQLVDDTVSRFRSENIEVVVAIGGGSVLDAAKAIAGLLSSGDSVMDYLEGVGRNKTYRGPSTPFIAVPTTAGTGSEATKTPYSACKARTASKIVPRRMPGAGIRHPRPGLAGHLLAGIDRRRRHGRVDPIAGILRLGQGQSVHRCAGLERHGGGQIRLFAAWRGVEPDAGEGRAAMAYAALLSGITLAQVGLGSVHGLASPLGAFFPIPHGVVCGTLVAAATEVNIRAMQAREPANPALAKYAQVGRLLSGENGLDDQQARDALIALLAEWSDTLQLERLGAYGIAESDFPTSSPMPAAAACKPILSC